MESLCCCILRRFAAIALQSDRTLRTAEAGNRNVVPSMDKAAAAGFAAGHLCVVTASTGIGAARQYRL